MCWRTPIAPDCKTVPHLAPDAAVVLSRNATMIEVVDGDTIDVSISGHREREMDGLRKPRPIDVRAVEARYLE